MPVSDAVLNNLFRGIDLTGVVANAVLGGVVARAQRLDPVGFGTLAILSGLGGGLIRDTLLQHGPPVALTDYAYILTALAGAVIAFFVRVEGRLWDRFFPVVDALAVGCWAAAGAQKTLGVGLGWLPATTCTSPAWLVRPSCSPTAEAHGTEPWWLSSSRPRRPATEPAICSTMASPTSSPP